MAASRVMTYNIYMGGRRGAALHEVVRGSQPDVLMVNESPKLPIVWRRQCHRLADKWGLRFVGGGRPAGSNMIAAAPGIQVKSVTAETFDTPLLKPRRGVVAAQLRRDGKLFGVVSCHLSLQREARLAETERIIEIVRSLRGPVILAGDLNERPGGPCWDRFRQAGFEDHGGADWKTFPSDDPEARIDALLVCGASGVRHHGDPGVPVDLQVRGSDHRPVLAVVDL